MTIELVVAEFIFDRLIEPLLKKIVGDKLSVFVSVDVAMLSVEAGRAFAIARVLSDTELASKDRNFVIECEKFALSHYNQPFD